MIMELAPGDLFMFPSSAIKHKNAALVYPDDRRYSFVQFSAAGLSRWVYQGHALESRLTGKEKRERDRQKVVEGAYRWDNAWESFLTWAYVAESSHYVCRLINAAQAAGVAAPA